MSRIADSKDPQGFIWILRHNHYDDVGFDLALRGYTAGIGVKDRDDNKGGLGDWSRDKDKADIGDLNGAQFWKSATVGGGGGAPSFDPRFGLEPRQISMWRWSTPVVTGKPIKTNDVPTESAGGAGSCATYIDGGKSAIRPIFSNKWDADTRFDPRPATRPPLSPQYPVGTYGISLAADNEKEQQDLFFPINTQLIAVNRLGDIDFGSRVYDMGPEFKIDPERFGRLQSMQWVIIKPEG